MHISSKGDYGIRALFDLAQHYGKGPVQSRDIHQRQAIDDLVQRKRQISGEIMYYIMVSI